MSQLAAPENCTGCLSCAAACPGDAIAVYRDDFGNIYPRIEFDRCIGCGKCQKSCPEMDHPASVRPSRAFAVWSLDPKNRKSSASGGAAAEFYAWALDDGYWISGAAYASDGHVIHTLCRECEAILRYKQSKYVYSEADAVYARIRERLDQGEKVLMISLPCKIAGLRSFLGKSYDNLVTADIVCHGTPSFDTLRNHIRHVAPGVEDYRLCFRQDNDFIFTLESAGKTVYQKYGRTDTYLAAFLEGLNYRPSCYQCRYACPDRVSDLTICDFWGLGTEIPFEHPYSGAVSAVLTNTQKGQAFFECCRGRLFVEERPVSEAIRGNAQLNRPTPVHPRRAAYETLYRSSGFETAATSVLHAEMKKEQIKLAKRRVHSLARKFVGLFLKRYRS